MNPLPFAILRTEKIKSWSGLAKSVGHNLRTSADDRQHLNPDGPLPRVLCGSVSWVEEWKGLVAGMWLPALKQGTTHTLAREFFLGASAEFFAGKSQQEIDAWATRNVDWLRKRFGDDRVKLVVYHGDEAVPHLAAYIVGLKEDKNRKGESRTRGNGWTLSDGVLGLGGSKEALAELQTEYAAEMHDLELRRGVANSKATHQTTAAWRKQLARPLDAPVIKPKVEAPTLADRVDVHGYGKRVADQAARAIFNQLKPYHQQAKAKDAELRRIKGAIERLKPLADAFAWLIRRLLGPNATLNTLEGLQQAREALARLLPPEPTPLSPPKPASVAAPTPAVSQLTPRPTRKPKP